MSYKIGDHVEVRNHGTGEIIEVWREGGEVERCEVKLDSHINKYITVFVKDLNPLQHPYNTKVCDVIYDLGRKKVGIIIKEFIDTKVYMCGSDRFEVALENIVYLYTFQPYLSTHHRNLIEQAERKLNKKKEEDKRPSKLNKMLQFALENKLMIYIKTSDGSLYHDLTIVEAEICGMWKVRNSEQEIWVTTFSHPVIGNLKLITDISIYP